MSATMLGVPGPGSKTSADNVGFCEASGAFEEEKESAGRSGNLPHWPSQALEENHL
jgi:hypothetical protein